MEYHWSPLRPAPYAPGSNASVTLHSEAAHERMKQQVELRSALSKRRHPAAHSSAHRDPCRLEKERDHARRSTVAIRPGLRAQVIDHLRGDQIGERFAGNDVNQHVRLDARVH
jgi:hypothetical protein